MNAPRFSDTPFAVDAFKRFASNVVRRSDGPRFVTVPHPAYLVQSLEALQDAFPANAKHVGWQSILIEDGQPVALFQAAPDAMGKLVNVSTIEGDLPESIVIALINAEREKLIGEDADFAMVTVPQVGLTALWLPAVAVVISVGPDFHREMRRGIPRDEKLLQAVVAAAFHSE